MPAIKRDDLFLEEVIVLLDEVYLAETWPWCALPYPDHPKGCPNQGCGSASCPPYAPYVEEVIDLTRPVWWVGSAYNLEGHRQRMWDRHPDWSFRQANCLLYWQPSVRKRNKAIIRKFMAQHPGTRAFSPEGLGVNVTTSLYHAGVDISWKRPLMKVHKGLMVGYPLPGCEDDLALIRKEDL
jgi:hypothetical protein